MTDADYEALKLRIKTVADRWMKPCGIGYWQDVTLRYYRDVVDWVDAFQESVITVNDSKVGARVTCDWRYKHGLIHFNCYALREHTDEELDYVVRHEICHLLVAEMREWQYGNTGDRALDHEERVVTELAMVLDWVRLAGMGEGRSKVSQSIESSLTTTQNSG